MQTDELEKVLISIGLDVKQRGHNFFAKCPSGNHADRRPSWGISLNEPHLHCCFTCGFKGTLTTLLVEIGKKSFREARRITGEAEYQKEKALVFDFAKTKAPDTPEVNPDELLLFTERKIVNDYLEGLRGVSSDVIKKAGILFDRNFFRLVFPWRLQGKLYAITGRAIKKSVEKEWGKSFMYAEGVKKRELVYLPFGELLPEPLVVVEGEIDALKVASAGFHNVCALGHSAISEGQAELLLHSPATEFYMFPDDDASGAKLASFAHRLLGAKKRMRLIDYAPVDRKKYRDGVALDPGVLEYSDISACLMPRPDSLFSFRLSGKL